MLTGGLLLGLLPLLLTTLVPGGPGRPGGLAPVAGAAGGATYSNPLLPTNGARRVENCPDPNVFRGAGAYARSWFMMCTSDPLDDADSQASPRRSTTLPLMRSEDLVHWRLVGSAASARPSWAAPGASLWAPDVTWSASLKRYVLSFAVTDVADRISHQPGCRTDRAIGSAVSTRPTGPWTPSPTPVVAPVRTGPGCAFADTIDPDLLEASGSTGPVLYFGSFGGGVKAAPVALSRTGMRVTGRVRAVTADRRYEAPDVVRHGGWYFLTVSAGDCCNGARTGYSVFAGRSRSPYGPFLDRTGASLLASRTGGTPVVAATGNRWVGPGHTSMFVDRGGQWWAMYHAVDLKRPYLAGSTTTRRPALLDPLDWTGGWPSVRAGRGPSSVPVAVPAAQAGQHSAYRPVAVAPDFPAALGRPDPARSDEFDTVATTPDPTPTPTPTPTDPTDPASPTGPADPATSTEPTGSPTDTAPTGEVAAGAVTPTGLDPRWSWIREPAPGDVVVSGGALRWRTRSNSLYAGTNTAPVLLEDAPAGDFVLEAKVEIDLPATGCCFAATQAGLIVHADDDHFVKLVHNASADTRQISFVREVADGPGRIGVTYVGPAARVTWLRLVRTSVGSTTVFRAWSSRDGVTWVRGSTWQADDLRGARIGLTAGGGEGFTATFDHVRVWSLPR